MFELAPLASNPDIRYNVSYSSAAVKEVFKDMLAGKYKSGHFVAFYGFPLDPELYVYDVREILEPALAKYGIEEWKACALTDEFHGHLGVFSIVGATLGQGNIHLLNESIAKPQAIFTYKDKSIRIKLKDEYLKKLKAVIDRGVKDYGLQDEDYWNLIRQTALKFWLEWDRNDIFELTVL